MTRVPVGGALLVLAGFAFIAAGVEVTAAGAPRVGLPASLAGFAFFVLGAMAVRRRLG